MRNTGLGKSLLICSVLASLSIKSYSHHLTAAFDFMQDVELRGKVKRFHWKNPHNYVQIIVTDENGKYTEWNLEVGTPETATRMGWRKDSFKFGDEVTIVIAPMKDGSPVGIVKTATFSDGSTLTSVANKPNASTPVEVLPSLKRAMSNDH